MGRLRPASRARARSVASSTASIRPAIRSRSMLSERSNSTPALPSSDSAALRRWAAVLGSPASASQTAAVPRSAIAIALVWPIFCRVHERLLVERSRFIHSSLQEQCERQVRPECAPWAPDALVEREARGESLRGAPIVAVDERELARVVGDDDEADRLVQG